MKRGGELGREPSGEYLVSLSTSQPASGAHPSRPTAATCLGVNQVTSAEISLPTEGAVEGMPKFPGATFQIMYIAIWVHK